MITYRITSKKSGKTYDTKASLDGIDKNIIQHTLTIENTEFIFLWYDNNNRKLKINDDSYIWISNLYETNNYIVQIIEDTYNVLDNNDLIDKALIFIENLLRKKANECKRCVFKTGCINEGVSFIIRLNEKCQFEKGYNNNDYNCRAKGESYESFIVENGGRIDNEFIGKSCIEFLEKITKKEKN